MKKDRAATRHIFFRSPIKDFMLDVSRKVSDVSTRDKAEAEIVTVGVSGKVESLGEQWKAGENGAKAGVV